MRDIGLRHRVKKTAAGEDRPTQVWILEEGMEPVSYELAKDTDELDWVRGRFPVALRKLEADESLDSFNPRHVVWRTVKKGEDVSSINTAHLRTVAGKQEIAIRVPSAYDGLKTGDIVAMSPGSGDRLAFALSRVGEKLGATVLRIPTSVLKDRRGNGSRDDDARLMAELAVQAPDLFHKVTANTRRVILVRELQELRIAAMKARIACEQRVRQSFIGKVFCTEEDMAELDIEAQFAATMANDRVLEALVSEEAQRIRDLDRAVQATDVWQEILANVTGVGPAIAGRLISAIGTIERFMVEPDQARLDALYEESTRLEREAGFTELRKRVSQDGTTFDVLRRTASWCANNGRSMEAAELERAVACHQERSRLRRDARNKGRAKLKAYCGVHLQMEAYCPECNIRFREEALLDEANETIRTNCPKCGHESVKWVDLFARRRAGHVSNWHPDARQALYLLGSLQFVRQGDRTSWGHMYRGYIVKMRATHPEVLCGTCDVPWEQCSVQSGSHTRKYGDGHIQRMAMWRTVTKFTEWLYDQWSALARREQLAAARRAVA